MNFWRRDGGKLVPKKGVLKKAAAAAAILLTFLLLYGHLRRDDSSLSTQRAHRKNTEEKPTEKKPYEKPALPPGVSTKEASEKTAPPPKAGRTKSVHAATQGIITRPEESTEKKSLPPGTAAVGMTIGAVDTRHTQNVRAILPYGMSHKGRRAIPKGSVLVGRISPKGGKVFIAFERAVFPNGGVFKVAAHALDPKDFTPGLRGRLHGNTDLKMAAAMGFSMAATMGDVLARKEALGGEYGRITVKSTLKDAAFAGVSEVAKAEAARRLEALNNEAHRGYATIPGGEGLIVVLTESFGLE